MFARPQDIETLRAEAVNYLGSDDRFERIHKTLEPAFRWQIERALLFDETIADQKPINAIIAQAIEVLQSLKRRAGLEFLQPLNAVGLRTVSAASMHLFVQDVRHSKISNLPSGSQSRHRGAHRFSGNSRLNNLR